VEKPKEKIGLFLVSETQRYQQSIVEDVRHVASRHGIEVHLFWAEAVAAKQARDVIHFLNENPRDRICVLMLPVIDHGEVVARFARRVLSKGADLIILNRAWPDEIRKLRAEYPDSVVAVVSGDNRRFGRIQGAQFRALLPDGGHVLYVVGNRGASSAIARREGMLEEIAGSSITVSEVEGQWREDIARDVIKSWLVSPIHCESQIHLVGCQNDAMAAGAHLALDQVARETSRPDLRRIPLTGGDGLEEEGILWVKQGKLAATIVMPYPGGPAVDLLAAAWREGRAVPAETFLDPTPYPPTERRPDRT
jgi:ABC-type sugar transport system substrate-binding protein